jgi:pectinesterase
VFFSITIVAVLVFCSSVAFAANFQLLEERNGFARASGGYSHPVYHVTNLNDSGLGSLRKGSGQSSRIVFDLSGTIKLHSPLRLSRIDNVIIDGTGHKITGY